MDCNEARPLLSAAIDRELSAAEALRVEQHLATCAECRREAQALQAVSEVTGTAAYFRAPDTLRERILAALPAVEAAPDEEATQEAPASHDPRQTRDKRRRRGALGWAWDAWHKPRGVHFGMGTGTARHPSPALAWPIGIAAVVLAVGVSLFLARPANTNAVFVDELVASHVRAQLSGHDIDVVSSDQHTVKPWFNGRLDYAPPVEDLADAGFALTGGRLDYIGHRRVGVLVYRYRKHIIDVYVMPDTDADARSAPAALTSDGYALASWRGDGMRWWAVSDAEPAVLAQLRSELTARLSRVPSGPLK
jgi:anti-sigma factor (TIGR02949 family)